MKRFGLSFLLLAMLPFSIFAQSSIDPNCTVEAQNACVDWERGHAIAIGLGAPAGWAKNAAQKNLSARRAARLDAARNILELIKGINISADTSMAQAMVSNDEVRTSVEGRLNSIRALGEPKYFSDGSVQIKLIANLREVVPPEVMFGDASGPPRLLESPGSFPSGTGLNQSSAYTGLIIDARGTGVQPAMSPKVFDPEGREVYGSAYVSRKWALSQGVVGYLKDVDKARENDRVKGNPAVVKATEAKGANKADLVLSKADADALRGLSQTQSFLNEGRVMIILD